MKIKEAIKIYEALESLENVDLPYITARDIADNLDLLETTYKTAIKKRRQIVMEHIVMKEGKPVQEDGSYKVRPGFNEKIEELFETETGVESLKTIREKDLESQNISAKIIRNLRKIISCTGATGGEDE